MRPSSPATSRPSRAGLVSPRTGGWPTADRGSGQCFSSRSGTSSASRHKQPAKPHLRHPNRRNEARLRELPSDQLRGAGPVFAPARREDPETALEAEVALLALALLRVRPRRYCLAGRRLPLPDDPGARRQRDAHTNVNKHLSRARGALRQLAEEARERHALRSDEKGKCPDGSGKLPQACGRAARAAARWSRCAMSPTARRWTRSHASSPKRQRPTGGTAFARCSWLSSRSHAGASVSGYASPKTVRWRARLGYERASPSAEGSPPLKRRKGGRRRSTSRAAAARAARSSRPGPARAEPAPAP